MERPLALVVDRDSTTRATLSETLERRGLEPLGAESGEGATEILKNRPVELLIADVQIRGADGRRLIDAALELTPAPVVIALVTSIDSEETLAFLDSGVFDVLARPLTAEAVQSALSFRVSKSTTACATTCSNCCALSSSDRAAFSAF